MSAKDPYRVLGVSSTASSVELKRALRIKQRETHPDMGGSNELFKEVAEAWDIVGNLNSRRIFDANHRAETFLQGEVLRRESGVAPENYRDAWGADFTTTIYIQREREDATRTRQIYSEQIEWFEIAKKRNAAYATSPVTEPKKTERHPFRDGLNSRGLRWYYVLLLVMGVAAIFTFAGNRDFLFAILPTIGMVLGGAALSGTVVSILIAALDDRD